MTERSDLRQTRLAQALRANLRRRKSADDMPADTRRPAESMPPDEPPPALGRD